MSGAVSTSERRVSYGPNMPRLQLELGLFYDLLRAYDVARNCLEQTALP
jgi:hypothetical protein